MFLCSHLIQKKNLKRTRSLCMVGSVPGGLPTTLVPRQIQHRRVKRKTPYRARNVSIQLSCPYLFLHLSLSCPYLITNIGTKIKNQYQLVELYFFLVHICPYLFDQTLYSYVRVQVSYIPCIYMFIMWFNEQPNCIRG